MMENLINMVNPVVIPEIIIIITAVILLLFGRRLEKFTGYIAAAGTLIALAALLASTSYIEPGQVQVNIYNTINIFYSFDLFAVVFKVLFLSLALLCIIASLKYMENRKNMNRKFVDAYYSLFLLSVLGMMAVVSSVDLITLFVGIEMAAIPAFVLVAYDFTRKGIEGATKYFLFGAVFSVFMLLGISFIYITGGSFMFTEIAENIKDIGDGEKLMLFIGFLAILSTLAFEMSAVPFHLWAPDAYQGAPAPVSALLSGASKKMAFAAAIKILVLAVIWFKIEMGIILAILAILSMIVGNIMALGQKDVKRMLAYSSIAQVGYILAAIAIFTPLGMAAAIYYIIVHAFMKGGAFIAAGAAEVISGGRIKTCDDYKGLAKRMPAMAFAMACFLFSLAGIVPFGGFTAKIVVLASLFIAYITGGSLLAGVLGLVMIITSVISLYYYGRVIKYMWFSEPKEADMENYDRCKIIGSGNSWRFKEPSSFLIPATLAVLALLILFYAPPFIELAIEVANSLNFM